MGIGGVVGGQPPDRTTGVHGNRDLRPVRARAKAVDCRSWGSLLARQPIPQLCALMYAISSATSSATSRPIAPLE